MQLFLKKIVSRLRQPYFKNQLLFKLRYMLFYLVLITMYLHKHGSLSARYYAVSLQYVHRLLINIFQAPIITTTLPFVRLLRFNPPIDREKQVLDSYEIISNTHDWRAATSRMEASTSPFLPREQQGNNDLPLSLRPLHTTGCRLNSPRGCLTPVALELYRCMHVSP